ncbi:unnamed protein product [Boreogadus saida]
MFPDRPNTSCLERRSSDLRPFGHQRAQRREREIGRFLCAGSNPMERFDTSTEYGRCMEIRGSKSQSSLFMKLPHEASH